MKKFIEGLRQFFKKNWINISFVVVALFLILAIVAIKNIEFKRHPNKELEKIILYEKFRGREGLTAAKKPAKPTKQAEKKGKNEKNEKKGKNEDAQEDTLEDVVENTMNPGQGVGDEDFCEGDLDTQDKNCRSITNQKNNCMNRPCCIWYKISDVSTSDDAPQEGCMAGGANGAAKNDEEWDLEWWYYKNKQHFKDGEGGAKPPSDFKGPGSTLGERVAGPGPHDPEEAAAKLEARQDETLQRQVDIAKNKDLEAEQKHELEDKQALELLRLQQKQKKQQREQNRKFIAARVENQQALAEDEAVRAGKREARAEKQLSALSEAEKIRDENALIGGGSPNDKDQQKQDQLAVLAAQRALRNVNAKNAKYQAQGVGGLEGMSSDPNEVNEILGMDGNSGKGGHNPGSEWARRADLVKSLKSKLSSESFQDKLKNYLR